MDDVYHFSPDFLPGTLMLSSGVPLISWSVRSFMLLIGLADVIPEAAFPDQLLDLISQYPALISVVTHVLVKFTVLCRVPPAR